MSMTVSMSSRNDRNAWRRTSGMRPTSQSPCRSTNDKATCLIVLYDRYLRGTRVALVNTTS